MTERWSSISGSPRRKPHHTRPRPVRTARAAGGQTRRRGCCNGYLSGRIAAGDARRRDIVAGQRVERKLAAILAADVAGYSPLTGLDEGGTLGKFRTFRRELIDPAISAHGGRLVKTTGDGLLIEFHSVVNAVRCAVHLQGAIAERNALTPSDRRLQFRIGIHVGDIVVEGDDLLGDGVNIAARLEAIAEPGGISLSEDAWRQVRDKLPLAFTDRGEQSVKNIARPIRVYDLGARSLSAAAD